MDDRPYARIAADRESIMVLGKTRFGGFFFVFRKVSPLNRNTANWRCFCICGFYEAINCRNT
jgi:hypothetical protein